MRTDTLLVVGRAIAIACMLFALIGIVLSYAGYFAETPTLQNADVSTHTRAFCTPQNDLLYCEDKLVAEHLDTEKIVESSPITGNAFIQIETT